jgi:anti-sigma factor (TIGR02949 family)
MTDGKIAGCRDLDERLAPYVDGEASPDARRAVDAHLEGCPPCRQRYEAERTAREILHGCRYQLRPAAPGALRARCAAFSRPAVGRRSGALRHWVPLSLAASLLLAVAGVFLFTVADHAQALADGLALDHVKCFEVRGDGRAPFDASAFSKGWEQRQGWPLVVPASAPSRNLRLLTVRRCFSIDGRVAHLMYLWNGEPLSVYILPRVVSSDRLVNALGHEAVIWSANGRTYAVLAEGHPAGLDQVISYVKANAK